MKQNGSSGVSNKRGLNVSVGLLIAVSRSQLKCGPFFLDCVVVDECNE